MILFLRFFPFLTFSAHAHFQTLFQPTVLALIPVVLVDGTVAAAPARVREIPADASLEKTFTP